MDHVSGYNISRKNEIAMPVRDFIECDRARRIGGGFRMSFFINQRARFINTIRGFRIAIPLRSGYI
ncbi:MAG: hypothetical protein J6Y54_02050 [Lentisphaeria bacterium]|nr:hypothetical protein [Lentisphaeria bacterium]